MAIPESVLFNSERVRSFARAVRVEASEMRGWTDDLLLDNVQWHREALAILEQTQRLVRERARLIRPPANGNGTAP